MDRAEETGKQHPLSFVEAVQGCTSVDGGGTMCLTCTVEYQQNQ
jgi:hypothetical protein